MVMGKGVTAGLPANRIFISDPSLRKSKDFNIGWYAGSKQQPDLQEILADVIRRIVRETGGYNVVFFGSSAGGYASLALSRFFPTSWRSQSIPRPRSRASIPVRWGVT